MLRVTALSCALCAPGVFAGDLNPPPGPVAPTMKTLDDVEPRTAINAENTPGDADSVFRIDTPGSFYLTDNVSHFVGASGIEIASGDVTIDLNGYRISGLVGSLGGIMFDGASGSRVVVRNGTVTGSAGGGVVLGQVSDAMVEGVVVRNVGGVGIVLGSTSTVRDCDVRSTESFGIRVSTGDIVRCTVAGAGSGFACFEVACCGSVVDCQATGSSGPGFSGQSDVVFERCVATGTSDGFVGPFGGVIFRDCNANFCQDDGFEVAAPASMTNCIARGCQGYGINGSGALKLRDVVAESNGLGGILAGANTLIESCTAIGNGSTIVHDGIEALAGSRIVGCVAEGNGGNGIAVNDGLELGTVIADCTARSNGASGIATDFGATIRGCSAAENGINGISGGGGGTVSGCSAYRNTVNGIFTGVGATVENCNATDNEDNGFSFQSASSLIGCTAYANTDDGFSGTQSMLRACTATLNGGDGFRVNSRSTLIENRAENNGGNGIVAVATDNRIEGNTTIDHVIGIQVINSGNLIVRNASTGNSTTAYSIVGGNDVGAIQTSIVGAGPWDNFDY